MASISKPITATGMMILVERWAIDLCRRLGALLEVVDGSREGQLSAQGGANTLSFSLASYAMLRKAP